MSLLRLIVKYNTKEENFGRQIVLKMFQPEDTNVLVETNTLKVSLMCPLSKARIRIPSRTINCQHVQCFDLEPFLKMNENKNKWSCPVCNREASQWNLIVCSLFENILANVKRSEVNDVEFLPDGNWTHKTSSTDGSFITYHKSIICLDTTINDNSVKEIGSNINNKNSNSSKPIDLNNCKVADNDEYNYEYDSFNDEYGSFDDEYDSYGGESIDFEDESEEDYYSNGINYHSFTSDLHFSVREEENYDQRAPYFAAKVDDFYNKFEPRNGSKRKAYCEPEPCNKKFKTDNGSSSKRCYSCNDLGHIARFCPQNRFCYNCRQIGHTKRECNAPINKTCFGCGQKGHLIYYCPFA